MGALLRDQVEANFKGKKVDTWMFKGSHSVHMPEAVYAFSDNYGIKGQKKNKEVFRNKRAQRYVELADRMFKTWEAVTAKERGEAVYHNPDELISFSSDIKCLTKLRAELCRLPRKKNNSGMIELYTKADMVAGITMSDGRKLSIPSPNLADDVMMSFDRPDLVRPVQSNAMPPSLNLPRYR
jgi:phage terminase large subunit